MPANLPPQFYALSMKLKEAVSPDEKISILEEMLRISPKHKGTENLQKDLKTKIAKLKKQRPKKIKGKTIYSIKKEGAGQVVISGPANSGKSSLLNALSNANVKVAPYPFTTKIPEPGMMPYEDILIQLMDTPPLTKNSPLWLKSTLRESDGILVVFDLASENLEKEIEELKEILENWSLNEKKIIFVGNKFDLGKENFERIKEKYKIIPISTFAKFGLEKLKREIFNLLDIMRVYTKDRHQKTPDFSHPFILKKGEKLIDFARKIHQDLAFSFKFGKLFKKEFKNPKIIGKDYLLEDGDIIEIYS